MNNIEVAKISKEGYGLVKKILRKNQIMITALAVMIAVAGYLNFAGTRIGEEDFISVDGSGSELTYEISDEDMYAISLREGTDGTISDYSEYAQITGTDGDILSLDSDDVTITENYLSSNMEASVQGMTANETGLAAADESTDGHGVLASNTDTAEANVIEQEIPGEAVFTSASGVSTLAGAKLLKEQTRAQNKETLLEIINNDSLTEDAKQEAVNSMITLTETAQKESDAQLLLEAKGYAQTVVSISGDVADVMIEATSLTDAQTAQIIDIVQRKTEIAPENIIITISGAE